jgi:hypothetical protein
LCTNHSLSVFYSLKHLAKKITTPLALSLAETTTTTYTNPACNQLLALSFNPSSLSFPPHAIFLQTPWFNMLVHQPSMDSNFRMKKGNLSHYMIWVLKGLIKFLFKT